MKNPIPPLVMLLFAWVVGGSILYNSLCCSFPGESLTIMDGGNKIAGARQNLVFSLGNSSPEASEQVKSALSKTAAYLQEKPDKVLLVTGKFHESEILGEEENPGLARASRTSEFLHTLGFKPEQIVVADGGSEGLTVREEKLYGAAVLAIAEIPNYSLLVEDGEAFRASSAQNLRFPKSAYQYEQPGPDVNEVLHSTARYLNNNPGKKLLITGQYADREENTSIFPNLGLARATQVKNILQEMGVSSAQIETGGLRHDELLFPGAVLHGAATYTFEDALDNKTNKEAVINLENNLRQQNILLYFERGRNKLILSAEERQYFADLIQYLDSKPSASVLVQGHASNTGIAARNISLSEERADFVKKYLVQNGLNASQIIMEAMGTSRPIASNKTEEGRARNRRVEVSVK